MPASLALSEELSALLKGVLPRANRFLVPDTGPTPRFLRIETAGKRLFAKVVPVAALATEAAAAAIAEAVAGSGICAPVRHCVEPVVWRDGLALLIFEHIDSGVVLSSVRESGRLGQEIVNLHAALRVLPPSIQTASAERSRGRISWLLGLNHDLDRCAALLDRRGASWAARELRGWPSHPWDTLSKLPMQVIHGDLNAGNLLRRSGDGRFVFLDFEEATRQVLPPVLDIAFAFERTQMPAETESCSVVDVLAALLEGYRARAGVVAFQHAVTGFRAALRWHMLTPMTILMELPEQEWTGAEWQKFRELNSSHENHASAIDGLLQDLST